MLSTVIAVRRCPERTGIIMAVGGTEGTHASKVLNREDWKLIGILVEKTVISIAGVLFRTGDTG